MEAGRFISKALEDIFAYNRENYQNDADQRQERAYAGMELLVAQGTMFRADLDDLAGLTEKKMDNTATTTVFLIGVAITLLVEGRLEPGTPPWLLRAEIAVIGLTVSYFFLALFLSIHAGNSAKALLTAMRTQAVRVQVPTGQDLEMSRTYGLQIEGRGDAFRVPFRDRVAGDATVEMDDPWQFDGDGPRLDPIEERPHDKDEETWEDPDPTLFFRKDRRNALHQHPTHTATEARSSVPGERRSSVGNFADLDKATRASYVHGHVTTAADRRGPMQRQNKPVEVRRNSKDRHGRHASFPYPTLRRTSKRVAPGAEGHEAPQDHHASLIDHALDHIHDDENRHWDTHHEAEHLHAFREGQQKWLAYDFTVESR
jgi:hypothetical protein